MNNQKENQSAVVVIPTYNEAENIRKLIPILFSEVFPKISGWKMVVVVVDGNSTDGTGEVVLELAKNYENVHLVKETGKNGIGAAYMLGFDFAIHKLGADLVIEFDADFQHPPETIISLIKKIDEGFDYVIGSRTILGGSEPAGRNFIRTFLSSFGGFLARFILFFPNKNFRLVTDPTSGLRATRVKDVFSRLDFDPVHLYSKKFGYKLQLLSLILATGARFAEVPLRFENRSAGISKFELGTVSDILFTCLKTRWAHFRFRDSL